jgi:hypothetical protein
MRNEQAEGKTLPGAQRNVRREKVSPRRLSTLVRAKLRSSSSVIWSSEIFVGCSWARVSVHPPVGFRAPRGKAWEPARGSVGACAHGAAQFEVSDFFVVFSRTFRFAPGGDFPTPHSPLIAVFPFSAAPRPGWGRTGRAHRYRFLLAHNAQRPPLPRESGPQTRGAGPLRERGRQRSWAWQKPVPMGPPHAAPTWPGSGSDGENSDEKRAGSGENPTGCAAKRAQRKGLSPSTLYARAREAAQFELGDLAPETFVGCSWARVSVHPPVGFRAPRGKAWEPARGSVDASKCAV